MGGIAAIVQLDGGPADPAVVRRMLGAVPYRGPDGSGVACMGLSVLGVATLALSPSERLRPGPERHPDGATGIAADARIYNRNELRAALHDSRWLPSDPSSAQLLLAAYERWGEEFVDRLDGDFAFVLWDARREVLVAARDPFGVKPLVYRTDGSRLLLASETRQIQADSDERIAPDDTMIWRYLVDECVDDESSYFEGIRRLRPGSLLRATRGGVSETPYWKPSPPVLGRPRAAKDVHAELRHRLARAVEKRIDVDAPVVAELSGGYDSSAIVVLASEARSRGKGPASLSTISSTYGDLPSDETRYIREVLRTTGLQGRLFDAREGELSPSDLLVDLERIGSPRGEIALGRYNTETRLLEEAGTRVLLSGLGGDEVFTPPDYVFDLVDRWAWLEVFRECRQAAATWRDTTTVGELARALKRAVPEGVRRPIQWYRRRTSPPGPPWLNPDLARERAGTARPGPEQASGESVALRELARWFRSPRLIQLLEDQELRNAARGVELRLPFLDRELVQFVLGVPFEVRRQAWPTSPFKAAARGALSNDLPELVLNRDGKVSFDCYFQELTERWRRELASTLGPASRWRTARYIRSAIVDDWLSRPVSTPSQAWWSEARPLWQLMETELWVRLVEPGRHGLGCA